MTKTVPKANNDLLVTRTNKENKTVIITNTE